MDSSHQGTWNVTKYRVDDEMVEPDPRTEPALQIEGTRVSGTMGVNRLTGEWTDDFPLGPLATTRMMGPPEMQAQEDALLGHLTNADTVAVVGRGMFLSNDGLLLVELVRSGTDEVSPSS